MGGRSISQWCRDYTLSRGGYYNGEKRQDDSVPLAISVGRRRIITDEEDAAWRKRRQARAEQDQKIVRGNPPLSYTNKKGT